MRKVNVEIAEDASRAEGGYAVVLLHGVASLPDGIRFRIKPIDVRDSSENEAAESWPKGEHRPVAVRNTEFGVEIVIGPEIVECPALLPGTVGVIEIAQAGVRGEFLWPSIRPTARPRRRHLSLVKAQRGTATGNDTGGWVRLPAASVDHTERAATTTPAAPAMDSRSEPHLADPPRIVVNVAAVAVDEANPPLSGSQHIAPVAKAEYETVTPPTAEDMLGAAQSRAGSVTSPPPLPGYTGKPAVEPDHVGVAATTAVEDIERTPTPRALPVRRAAMAAAVLLAVLGAGYQYSSPDHAPGPAAASDSVAARGGVRRG